MTKTNDTMRNPFPIVMDQYAEGAEKACLQLMEQRAQGALPETMLPLEQELLKASFAFLAMEFVAQALDGYWMDDFEYFTGEMQYDEHRAAIWYLIGRANIPWTLDYEEDGYEITERERFEELFRQLLNRHYRKIWKAHFDRVIGNGIAILSFFQEVVLGGITMSFEEQSEGLSFIQSL